MSNRDRDHRMTGVPAESTRPGPGARFQWAGWIGLLLGLGVAGWWGWSAWQGRTLYDQGVEAVRLRQYEAAEALLARAQAYRPRDPDVLKLRVRAALARQDRETAQQVLAQVPDSAPDVERARMTRGMLLMELFRYREAEQVFRAVLARNPALDEAYIQLITLTGLKRQGERFEADLWAFHDHCGAPLAALRMLAAGRSALPERSTVDRTIDEGALLERGLAADPTDPELRPPLARYYLGRGQVDQALALLEPWLAEGHGDDAMARTEWLACRLEQGELESLAPWFETPLASASRLARYWMLRGEWLSRQNRHAEAADGFRQAAGLDPRDAEPQFRLGMALRAAGQPEQAAAPLEWVQQANQLKSLIYQIHDQQPDPDLMHRAGQLCLAMGRMREARAWLAAALRQAPERADLRQALESIGSEAAVAQPER